MPCYRRHHERRKSTGAVILERSEESQGGASLRVWLILHPRPFATLRVTKSVYFRGIGKFALQNNTFLYRLPRSIKVFLLMSIMTSIFALILSGCSTGAYPVDVFPEGHYQQSYRSQEPPRLQPPTDSVPIAGKEIIYGFAEAGNLTNPLSPTPETMAKATQIYQVNCAICHGISGRGDGPMAAYFQQSGAPPPLDYASPRVRSRKAGELYWIITNGLGVMPRFGPLLTVEERWALVHFINSVSSSNQ